ncbi:hypothetical protein ScPMuIL_012084 [Solemya velum]
MISALSRLKPLTLLLRQNVTAKINPVRHGGQFVYRTSAPAASKKTLFKAEVIGFLLWYWILYHIWYEPEHLIGHYEYPDPSKWTDEELGIPPDDVE